MHNSVRETLLEELDRLSRAENAARVQLERELRAENDQLRHDLHTASEANAELERKSSRARAELLDLQARYDVDTFKLQKENEELRRALENANRSQALAAETSAAQAEALERAMREAQDAAYDAERRLRGHKENLAALEAGATASANRVRELEAAHNALDADKSAAIEQLEFALKTARDELAQYMALEDDYDTLGSEHKRLLHKLADAQADRARERAELEDAIHQLEYEAGLLKSQLAGEIRERSEAQAEAKSLGARVAELTDALAARSAELGRESQALAHQTAAHTSLTEVHFEKIRECEMLLAANDALRLHQKTLDEQRAELQAEAETHLAALRKRLTDAELEIDAVESELDARTKQARADAAAAASREAELARLLEASRVRAHDAEARAAELGSQNDALQGDLDTALGQVSALRRELAELDGELLQLMADRNGLLDDKAALTAERERLTGVLAELQASSARVLRSAETQIGALQDQVQALQADHAALASVAKSTAQLRDDLASARTESSLASEALRVAELRVRELEGLGSASTKHVSYLESQLAAMQADYERLRVERDELRNQLRRLEADYFSTKSAGDEELAQLQRAMASLEVELGGLRTARESWQAKYDALLDQYEDLEMRSAQKIQALKLQLLHENEARAALEKKLLDEVALRAALQARLGPQGESVEEALARLQAQLTAEFDGERARLEAQIEALMRQAAAAANELADAQRAASDERKRRVSVEDSLDALEAKHRALSDTLLPQLELLQDRIDALTHERDELLRQTQTQVLSLEHKLDAVRRERDAAMRDVEAEASRRAALEADVAVLRHAEAEYDKARRAREELRAHYESSLGEMRSQVAQLRSQLAQAEALRDDAEAQTRAEKRERVQAEASLRKAQEDSARLDRVLMGKTRELQQQLSDIKAQNRSLVNASREENEALRLQLEHSRNENVELERRLDSSVAARAELEASRLFLPAGETSRDASNRSALGLSSIERR